MKKQLLKIILCLAISCVVITGCAVKPTGSPAPSAVLYPAATTASLVPATQSNTVQTSHSLSQAKPYRIVSEGNLANEDANRSVGLWFITSEKASSFEEYAQTAVQATLDLYKLNENDFTAVMLVPRPEVRTVYAEASYAADGKGAAGMTGASPAVPKYWHVRAMDDLQYNEQELAVMKLWQDKLADFPSRDPLSSLSYDEKSLRQYIADKLHITYAETQPCPRKIMEYKVDATAISPIRPSATPVSSPRL